MFAPEHLQRLRIDQIGDPRAVAYMEYTRNGQTNRADTRDQNKQKNVRAKARRPDNTYHQTDVDEWTPETVVDR